MRSKEQGRISSAPGEQRHRARGGRASQTAAALAQKAFQRRYPDIVVAPELFRLLGIDPPLNLESEREGLRELIADRFARK